MAGCCSTTSKICLFVIGFIPWIRIIITVTSMWWCGFILVGCVGLVFVHSKSVVDPELSKDFWDQLPPDFIERLQQTLGDYGPYDTNTDDKYIDWSEYEDARSKLREVPAWPSKQTQALIGQVGGVAVDTDGNLVVFHRADRSWDRWSFGPLEKLDPALRPIHNNVITKISPRTGEVISQLGAGAFYMPHGLTIDNDDNMWLTDVGLHQVLKIPKGTTTPIPVLGEKLVPGSDDTHFCKPTDVAVATNGEFFVADGYCNGRILKYSKDESLITQWGHVTSGIPGDFDFHIPHSLALDETSDLICVADRENGRIQCYDAGLNGTTAGDFRHGFEPGRGKIYAIEFDSTGDRLFAVNGPGIGIIEGFTLDAKGNIIETWGPESQDFPGQPHDVTVSRDDSDVYVGDIGKPSRVWRFSRQ